MTRPEFQTFQSLARQGNLIPVYREILGDTETPVSAFLKLNRTPSFLLESVVGGEKWARYSFLGIDPAMVITRRDGVTSVLRSPGPAAEKMPPGDDPLAVVKQVLSVFRPVPVAGVPRFSGGFVGFVGYDTVKSFERVPDLSRPGIPAPDVFLMLADTMLIFDNLKQTIKVLTNVHLDGDGLEEAYRQAEAKIEAVIEQLRTGAPPSSARALPSRRPAAPSHYGDTEFSSNFEPRDFLDAVSRAKEYVMAGDVVQVVLSQRFETGAGTPPFDIYRALRVINPSPYMYYLDIGDLQLVGSSPEILVRVESDTITLRPIAGTRRRGETDDEDRAMEEELRKDPKEMAEHIMLVDLGRNDVGRVAEIGSVRVTELMNVERYSHVMHLVSNVEGKLKRGLDCFDVFRACFPAGTVTGAPKVRAMEIIEELEPTRRGPYAGAVGYFGYSGNMDTCITIRTLVIKDGRVYVQAGAGIVADSVPEREYMETVNKARAMMDAVDFLGRSPQCSS